MARASGLALLPAGNDEHQGGLRRRPAGVDRRGGRADPGGPRRRRRRIIVGCGGSASTDGGWGAVRVVGSRSALEHIDLVVAADVRTTFVDAARVFGPQKGADPEQVRTLTERLERLVDQYRDSLGVDVQTLEGAGAAGGLAGGLAAVGGHIVGGFELVAGMVDLAGALDGADVVMTGEGRLDATSLDGKVVGGVLERCARPHQVLCVVGSVAAALPPIARRSLDLVVLEELVGANRGSPGHDRPRRGGRGVLPGPLEFLCRGRRIAKPRPLARHGLVPWTVGAEPDALPALPSWTMLPVRHPHSGRRRRGKGDLIRRGADRTAR